MVSSHDVERLFLQAVLSRGVLSAKLAQILWIKSIDAVEGRLNFASSTPRSDQPTAADPSIKIPDDRGKKGWESFLIKVNKSINNLDLEFRSLHDEATNREMYALVNRKDDEIAQMATDYTLAEITYFKAIVDQIMLAPNETFSVSSLAALREVSAIKPKSNMSKTQAEVVLGSFVAKGWLFKSKGGRYSLSTRSLLELQSYLKDTYPEEIVECTICIEMMTRGIACYTKNCKTRMHFHCFTVFRRHNGVCPTCGAQWPETANEEPLVPVGEDAVREGQDGKRRVRMRDTQESDEDEDILMEEDADEDMSQKTKRSQRSKKGKAPANRNVDMDDDESDDAQEVPPKRSQGTRRSSRK